MSILNESTLVPLGMFISGLVGAGAGGVMYGKAMSKIDGHARRLDDLERSIAGMSSDRERLVRIETQMQSILEKLEKLDEKLEAQ